MAGRDNEVRGGMLQSELPFSFAPNNSFSFVRACDTGASLCERMLSQFCRQFSRRVDHFAYAPSILGETCLPVGFVGHISNVSPPLAVFSMALTHASNFSVWPKCSANRRIFCMSIGFGPTGQIPLRANFNTPIMSASSFDSCRPS